ncbi:hypothetical protein R3P38DRAFT_1789436 [Favolaschia claudopus]|uniref:Uncharacterized protein n=1 Tax=Favolaschia claudopus TaxID=2862362 RepID=A0AAW0A592_9AGAR
MGDFVPHCVLVVSHDVNQPSVSKIHFQQFTPSPERSKNHSTYQSHGTPSNAAATTYPTMTTVLIINGVIASISSVLYDAYPQRNETEFELCFLTIGLGGELSSARSLRLTARLGVLALRNPNVEQANETLGKLDESLPIEKARLRLLPTFLAFIVGPFSCLLEVSMYTECSLY